MTDQEGSRILEVREPPMHIVDASWHGDVNRLLIECHCGKRFPHRADRWVVVCPGCHGENNLGRVRKTWGLQNH